MTLLLLNACIVEGILRTWLSTQIKNDLGDLATERMNNGKTDPTRPETIAESYLVQVEHTGGWKNLNDQYREYLAVKLSVLGSYSAINQLFTLRNVIGHGTSIVIPKNPSNAPGSEYTDRWQKKLEAVKNYVTSNLAATDILDALGKSEISKHFLDHSKIFVKEVAGKYSKQTVQSSSAYSWLDGYNFGFR